jgi:hypothetical protein
MRRRELDLEHYTRDEEYQYLGLPPKPYWFKNLEKAWEANRTAGQSRREVLAREEDVELYRYIGKPPRGTDAYIEWCDMMVGHLKKRKVGRPKLGPDQRKKPKLKRSEQMRQILKENGIEVLEDSILSKHTDFKFLPNGRIGLVGSSVTISVHKFLQNFNAK